VPHLYCSTNPYEKSDYNETSQSWLSNFWTRLFFFLTTNTQIFLLITGEGKNNQHKQSACHTDLNKKTQSTHYFHNCVRLFQNVILLHLFSMLWTRLQKNSRKILRIPCTLMYVGVFGKSYGNMCCIHVKQNSSDLTRPIFFLFNFQ